MRAITVTGSTGRLGGRVARRLAAAGVPQRLVVRNPARAPIVRDCHVVVAEYGDRAASRQALDGAGVVLMVSGSETLDRVDRHRSFVDAAADAGVDHVVYVSFVEASPTSTFTLARDHWATEQHIRASGLPFTFLRDSLYADFLPLMFGSDGVIRGPAGAGRVAVVAQDDIAEVAAGILQAADDHVGATHDLTGPEALTFHEVAAAITEATGSTVTFHDESLDEAYISRARYGAPGWEVEAWVSTYLAVATGELAGVSDAIPTLTGHPATSLATLLAQDPTSSRP